MKTKILVTGGAGYIGSTLVPILLKKGYTITVLDSLIFNQSTLLDCCADPNFVFVQGDICDHDLVKSLLPKFDIVIPLAAIVGAPACMRNPSLTRLVNYDAHMNIVRNVSSSQKVLFPTTNSGYGIGRKEIFCTEETPLNPISHYGRTKVAGEKALLEMGNAVTFRLATVFGTAPRMRMDLLVNDFVYRAFKDRFIVLFESHFKRNYIHIRDIASVFLLAIHNYESMKGEAYNIGLSDANLSKKELCEKIKTHLPNFHIFESDIAQDPDKRDYIVSNEKIESTGWKPGWNIDDGIAELIKFYSYIKPENYYNV